jgi:ankyrin repeat protein
MSCCQFIFVRVGAPAPPPPANRAAGADANAKDNDAATSVLWGAAWSTAGILQLLIDGGASANEPDNYGQTSLIVLVMDNYGDAVVRLQMLLACPELDLDAKYDGKTAEQWAVDMGYVELAVATAQERAGRERWTYLRAAWIAATIVPSVFLSAG